MRMGWGDPPASGLQLFEDPARPGIYTNTWLMANQLTGAAFIYKNTFFHPAPASTVWEDGDNKSVTFVGNEPTNPDGYHMITVGPTLFDNFLANTNDYLPADTLVTFTVSMTNAQSYPAFTPPISLRYVHGRCVSTATGSHGGIGIRLRRRHFNLTNGTSGDWIYSQTVLLPKGSPSQLVYKYGIDDDGVDQPEQRGPGRLRPRALHPSNRQLYPGAGHLRHADRRTAAGELTIGTPSGGSIPVSWLGLPGAYLQTSTDLSNPAVG